MLNLSTKWRPLTLSCAKPFDNFAKRSCSGRAKNESIFGVSAVALFDRPVDATTASKVTNYSIPNNSVASAGKQISGRLVFANLSEPERPLFRQRPRGAGWPTSGTLVLPESVSLQSLSQNPGVWPIISFTIDHQ